MATIAKRSDSTGKTRYLVKVRIKGCRNCRNCRTVLGGSFFGVPSFRRETGGTC
jgi:hypothetical protein